MKWIRGFFGSVKVPTTVDRDHAEALAHIAWRGGIYEDEYKEEFVTWFYEMANKYPTLFQVYVPSIYPINELRWIGEYRN